MIEALFIFLAGAGNLHQPSVRQLDAAVGAASHGRVVGDHHDGVALAVEFVEKLDHDFFVGLVQVAGGLVGQNQGGMIDQRPSDGHALLLAPR